MANEPNEESRQRRSRHRIDLRVTEMEEEFIRSAAQALDMTITEYIVQKAVYEAERDGAVEQHPHGDSEGSGSGYSSSSYAIARVSDYQDLKEILKELKAQGRNLNTIARSAATIALDTRSLSSKRLAESLDRIIAELRPVIHTSVVSVCECLGAIRPRRR